MIDPVMKFRRTQLANALRYLSPCERKYAVMPEVYAFGGTFITEDKSDDPNGALVELHLFDVSATGRDDNTVILKWVKGVRGADAADQKMMPPLTDTRLPKLRVVA